MIHYVQLKHPILSTPDQFAVPTGKTRTTTTGAVEAEFIPISKGYYREKTWLTQNHLWKNKEPPNNQEPYINGLPN